MPPRATRTVENSFHRLGYPRVAGVDEVGRGCLAGPVAVGVVVLDPRRPVPGLRDSKLLTADARERLSRRIQRDALAWAIGWAERITSTLSMVGEWSGKMRSTPWPNDTLRTVKDARTPPRCMPITMPSYTWMRSLSPSRTLT